MPERTTQKTGKSLRLSGWHPEDVKAAIRKTGQTLTSLSVFHGFSESYLRSVLIRPLYEGEQIIARFLKVPAHHIWPDRYHANGQSKIHRAEKPRRAA